MPSTRPLREIRADHDRDTIVVYQAYSPAIAGPAVAAQKFVAPFSFSRMTWIKPSFLWMMERCGWGEKPGQEVVLAVRITRAGWEEALGQATLTERGASGAPVLVQWDPERSIRGGKLEYRSIQVGLSRHLIRKYADEWVVAIADESRRVARMRELRKAGDHDSAARLLPAEKPYPLGAELMQRLGII
jgi:hypothetical protein